MVVVGAPPPPPETLEGESRWVVVRVGCDGPWSTWGPIEDGRRRIEALLGQQSPRWDEALDRMGTSTRFLGDMPPVRMAPRATPTRHDDSPNPGGGCRSSVAAARAAAASSPNERGTPKQA